MRVLDPCCDDIIIDIETNGFKHRNQQIHCLEIVHLQSGTQFRAADQPGYLPLAEALTILEGADRVIGHNIAQFDLPCIERLYGLKIPAHKIVDTLLVSRVVRADLAETDARAGIVPANLRGKHSLEGYGHRLQMQGLLKDAFQHRQDQPWSKALQDHCANDVLLQWAVFLDLLEAADSQDAPFFATGWYGLERDLIPICNAIADHGFPIAVGKAHALLDDLTQQSAEFAEALQKAFPSAIERTPFTPRRNNKTKGWIAGQTILREKAVPFNVNSSQQIADWLIERYGWQPTVLTEGGAPCTKAEVLATLEYPEARLVLRYKTAAKRITMLTGEAGYLTQLGADNRLHTEYFTLGARTGRASHRPNVAQVPSVTLGADDQPLYGADGGWGFEFRDCFVAPPGWVLVGSDQKGIEARILAHLLARWDDGDYAHKVCNGADLHEINRQTTGVATRAKAKRLLYATIFGCGNRKAGTIVVDDEDDDLILRALGKMAKEALIGGIRGFAELFAWLGQLPLPLPGLDDRPLFPRSDHTRLNTLIQSAGAIICKKWLFLIDAALTGRALGPEDYAIVAWVHDEVVIACRPDIAEIVAQVCRDTAVASGQFYNLQCPTEAGAAIGASWAMIH
ncbi:MAG: DNA polymerase [Rhodopila sp.]